MTCDGCVRKVQSTLKTLAPSVIVSLNPPQAILNEPVSAIELNAALTQVGKYRVSATVQNPVVSPALNWFTTYYPLFLVVGLIAIASTAQGNWMTNFMGGFFTVFGAFKLLDVASFANAYARYDIIAKRFRPWGYAYPFIETALGFAFLFHWQLGGTLWLALVLSIIGSIGVIQANLSKQTIECACLGTVFKLPMSVVTIVENLGMAAMAVGMLALR